MGDGFLYRQLAGVGLGRRRELLLGSCVQLHGFLFGEIAATPFAPIPAAFREGFLAEAGSTRQKVSTGSAHFRLMMQGTAYFIISLPTGSCSRKLFSLCSMGNLLLPKDKKIRLTASWFRCGRRNRTQEKRWPQPDLR